MSTLDFYTISLTYIDFLRNYERENRGDTKVPNLRYHDANQKFTCGVVYKHPEKNIKYYVGITSYSVQKSENILIRVSGDTPEVKGSLRFNYMFPVPDSEITRLVINDIQDTDYRNLVFKEYRFIKENEEQIIAKADEVYNKIYNGTCSDNLKNNSCDFKILEDGYNEFINS